MKIIDNTKFIVREYQFGWIATRKSDGFKTYFENHDELMSFINS